VEVKFFGLNGKNVLPLAFVVLVAIAMMAFGWVGYYGSDDMSYAAGGLGWLNNSPYVGNSHWTLRHTIVAPMGLAFLIGGIGEFTLVLPTVVYFIALVIAVYVIVARNIDSATGVLAAFFVSTLPLMATQSTLVVPDFAEVFFCLVSLGLFLEATKSERPVPFLLLAGIAAGFSWLTRETVIFFLFSYAILFLFGFGIRRPLYFIMMAGFAVMVGAEFLYFAVVEGNAFHRLFVDFKTHLRVDVTEGADVVAKGFSRIASKVEGDLIGNLSRTGNLSVNRLIDPLLVPLLNQEFMFFHYVATPAAAWFAFAYRGDLQRRTFLRVFGLVGLVWFLCIWLQIGMTLLPRYYMLPTIIVAMLFAAWLKEVLWPRWPILTVGVLCFLFLTNLLGVYIDNRNPIFAERALTDFLLRSSEVVYTDPETARRGWFLYKVAGVEDRVKAAEPEPGVLFFSNPKYVVLGLMVGGSKAQKSKRLATLSPYLPQESWDVEWREAEERRWVGWLMEELGLRAFVPKEIYRRLDTPNPSVTMYRP
jgi:4-amino-4-deoxy-L-arabinose transferase-like glycosyltransferase